MLSKGFSPLVTCFPTPRLALCGLHRAPRGQNSHLLVNHGETCPFFKNLPRSTWGRRETGVLASPKALEFIKNEDLQQMGLALQLFDLRLLTTWAWWFSPGHWGFHLGMAAGNLIQVGFQVQGWKESTSLSSLALLAGRRVV